MRLQETPSVTPLKIVIILVHFSPSHVAHIGDPMGGSKCVSYVSLHIPERGWYI